MLGHFPNVWPTVNGNYFVGNMLGQWWKHVGPMPLFVGLGLRKSYEQNHVWANVWMPRRANQLKVVGPMLAQPKIVAGGGSIGARSIVFGRFLCLFFVCFFVCLFVCFFDSKITGKRLDRFAWNFQGRCGSSNHGTTLLNLRSIRANGSSG